LRKTEKNILKMPNPSTSYKKNHERPETKIFGENRIPKHDRGDYKSHKTENEKKGKIPVSSYDHKIQKPKIQIQKREKKK
jgi:hypothetical protein